MLSDFTSEVSTNISSFCVNTATDSSEESNSGATETIARDELEEKANLVSNLKFGSLGSNKVHNAWSVGKNQNFKNSKSESDKAETKNLTT